MNLNQFSLYQTRTNTFTNHQTTTHRVIPMPLSSANSTKQLESMFQSLLYPDIVISAHLEWVKTIKTVYPAISFKYVHPAKRKVQTLKYFKKLGSNAPSLYQTLLKI